jgi:protein-S-isoprenylcysteine O-methyltransferase Ste14
MKKVLTNLASFILPFTVLILVPYWLTGFIQINCSVISLLGLFFLFVGLSMLIITISVFIRKGKGTLAPWSLTKKLVITGMHAYVRNPMILGVIISLGGEALILTSLKIFWWLIIFFIINHFYFLFFEEPSLLKRFGKEYADYKKHVKRWIPRIQPYRS